MFDAVDWKLRLNDDTKVAVRNVKEKETEVSATLHITKEHSCRTVVWFQTSWHRFYITNSSNR